MTGEREGAWGYATGRAEAQVPRLALIYALLDGRLVIEPDHLKAANAVWRYCDASARYLFAESAADPVGNKILDALRAAGGAMTQTALHATFGRNLPAEKLGTALTLLQEHGRITSETRKTSGRPSVVWRLNEERRINEERDTSFFFLRKKEDREQPTTPRPVDNSVSWPVDNFPGGAMPVDNSVATELAALANLDVARMLAGDLTEGDWPGITAAQTLLAQRTPEKSAELTALVVRIDAAYCGKVWL